MKRLALLLLALPLLVVLYLLLTQMRWKFSTPAGATAPPPTTNSTSASIASAQVTAVPSSQTKPGPPLLGETILRDYANTNLPPQNDLTLMSRLMENSLLLLKSAGHRPLSANEDWAELLRGENAARERFLPDQHVALNSQGQLIDRWGSPLFFQAVGGGRYEVRCAGPERKLWTADDLHRNADGSFRRGAALNPPSLLNSER
jgi:hypothetical protein